MRWLRYLVPVIAFSIAFMLLSSFGQTKALIGAVFAMTVSLWIGELLPLAVTALLSTALLILIGGIKEKDAFSAYGDPIIPLFIGSFMLAKAMELTGLSERFAHSILRRPWASSSAPRLLFTLNAVACVLSLLVSNTAVTAMLLPVGLSVIRFIGAERSAKFATAAMLTLTWGSSIAVGVPVGTPPNLIGISLIAAATGQRITFVQWMIFGMPITVVILIASWLLLLALYGKDAPNTSEASQSSGDQHRELGPMRSSERVVLAGFIVAMFLWVVPDLSEVILGKTHAATAWMQSHITAAVASLVGAAVLFLVPAKDRPSRRALTWSEATTIDWGTILLFGGGIALGQALFSCGLAKDLGEVAARASGAHDLWSITALCIFASIVLSELASNTAAATTLVPVAIGLAQGAHVSPIAPALGTAIGASFGFMLPVSTAPNAIVYSSGLVPPKEMLKAGLLLDIIGFIVILLGLRIVLPMMGLA